MDRIWTKLKDELDKYGYKTCIISLDISEGRLRNFYESKSYGESLKRIGQILKDHENFLQDHHESVNLHISDSEFADRLILSRQFAAAWIGKISTTEELLDIFDENNQPTGKTELRSVVHRERIGWHRTTDIWIVNRKKEVLCQQRSLNKDAQPGKWMPFFGGHLQAGETFLENAITELKEELGITVSPEDIISLYTRRVDDLRHFTETFVLEWNGNLENLVFSDNEVEKVEWLSLRELEKRIMNGEFCPDIETTDQRVLDYILARD